MSRDDEISSRPCATLCDLRHQTLDLFQGHAADHADTAAQPRVNPLQHGTKVCLVSVPVSKMVHDVLVLSVVQDIDEIIRLLEKPFLHQHQFCRLGSVYARNE